jgi:hypothetical protein
LDPAPGPDFAPYFSTNWFGTGTFSCEEGSTLLQLSVRTGDDHIETAGRVITTSVCKRVMEIVVDRMRTFYGAIFIELVITDDCASGKPSSVLSF